MRIEASWFLVHGHWISRGKESDWNPSRVGFNARIKSQRMEFGKVALVEMESTTSQPYRLPLHLSSWHGKRAQAVYGGLLRQSIISDYLMFVKPNFTCISRAGEINLENPIQNQNNLHKQEEIDQTQYRIWRISEKKKGGILMFELSMQIENGADSVVVQEKGIWIGKNMRSLALIPRNVHFTWKN